MRHRKKVRTIAEPKTYVVQESGEEVELPKKKIPFATVCSMSARGQTHEEIAKHFGTTKQVIDNMFYKHKKKAEAKAAEPPKKRGRPPGSKNKRTIAEEKMMTNWQTSPINALMREDKADLNRAAGYFVTECLKMGQTVDKEDIESLYNGLQQYVALCTQTGMPMLVKTCNLALGVTGTTLTKWRNGTQRANDPRYREFAELVESVIGAGIEAAGAAGSVDRILTIWWQKAYFNMKESDGLSHEKDDPLGEKKSASEITQKYAELLPEDN
jgi:hypothetical protein